MNPGPRHSFTVDDGGVTLVYDHDGDEVAELLDTGRRTHPTADLRERAVAKRAEIDRRIADLHTIRTALTQVIDARCDSLTHCTCPDCPLPFAELADPACAC